MLFVYLLEAHPEYGQRTREILTKMNTRRDRLCTSAFTLGELLTGPLKRDAPDLAGRIRQALKSPHVELLSFDSEAAETYSQIRAKNRVAPADAIHLACASRAGTDLFLTNDQRLHRIVVPGISFIVGLDASVY
jgi:predicted nucleic acid-binding protein